MTDQQPSRMRKIARRAGALGVVAASVATASVLVSSALFTTSADTNGSFDAGSVKIGVTPSTSALTFARMAPGDTVIAPVTVTNSGNLEMRYAVSSTATGPDAAVLGSALKLKIKSGLTAAQCPAYTTGGATTTGLTAMNTAGTGTLIYGSAAAAIPGTTADTFIMGTPTKTPIIGNPAIGQNASGVIGAAGADRLLAGGAAEVLCVQVTMPLPTDSTVMEKVAGLTLTFDGEQTKNN